MPFPPQMQDEEEMEPVDFSDPNDADTEAMLQELQDADNAGEDFEAKHYFEDVPGTENPSEANEMPADADDAEKLKTIMIQLGQ